MTWATLRLIKLLGYSLPTTITRAALYKTSWMWKSKQKGIRKYQESQSSDWWITDVHILNCDQTVSETNYAYVRLKQGRIGVFFESGLQIFAWEEPAENAGELVFLLNEFHADRKCMSYSCLCELVNWIAQLDAHWEKVKHEQT